MLGPRTSLLLLKIGQSGRVASWLRPRMGFRSITSTSVPRPSDKHTKEEDREEATPDETTDFLSKHAGKIGLGVFSGIAWFIYRWFQGGKNKRLVEESLSNESPLHPYESNDLRVKNNISPDQYKSFANDCISHFSCGTASYKDFLLYLRQVTNVDIVDGYVLDRLALFYIQKHLQMPHASLSDDIQLPLSFLLVLFSNVLAAPPEERTECLFELCQHLPYPDNMSSICDMNGDIYCSKSQVEMLVTALVDSWQVCVCGRGGGGRGF